MGVHKAEKWYIHKLEKVLEPENCKILWDRPDLNVIDKKSKKCILIDPACPFDTLIEKKEEKKCKNDSELKYKIAKI